MAQESFFEKDYKVPTTSNYMKLVEGSNKFRILSSSIVGYEYFSTENKPVRSREPFDETPNMKPDGRVNHFWAFLVWNYGAERIQILEISQKSIQNQMKDYIDNSDWGNPINTYDFTIKRTGTGKNDTAYSVMPSPKSETKPEITEALSKVKVNLNVLFENGKPFEDGK